MFILRRESSHDPEFAASQKGAVAVTHTFKSTLDVHTTQGDGDGNSREVDWEDELIVEYTHAGESVELTQVFNGRKEEILDSLRDRDRARLIGEAWEDVVRRDEISNVMIDDVLDVAVRAYAGNCDIDAAGERLAEMGEL